MKNTKFLHNLAVGGAVLTLMIVGAILFQYSPIKNPKILQDAFTVTSSTILPATI